MRRHIGLRTRAVWLLAAGLALWLAGSGVALGETLKVTQENMSLYPEASFGSTPIAPVPVGTEVNVTEKQGDWYKVEVSGKSGWMPRMAFPQPSTGSKLGLPSMLFGAPAKETKSDEVALAGKGFTPEVESAYRQKHPEVNFAQVDKVEGFKVDPGKLQAFIKEGELNP